ncbi:hypothetical protein HWV23_03430 [Natronomonas halophila]|uniref:hypothetical protein n=1 Tax=Natronomonas halophila TaxID=2747817 RepID=UPI0015B52475|nr:hypothetical protein [Natronomonas halophila]QLD84803.1 hypothetical protein HWV23_03430 [Natronomonas halophila]
MPHETGTVTEVGAGNIQFYIPADVSRSDACPFDPHDEFSVRTIAGVGLLLTPVEVTPTIADLLDGLDIQTPPDAPLADHRLQETD